MSISSVDEFEEDEEELLQRALEEQAHRDLHYARPGNHPPPLVSRAAAGPPSRTPPPAPPPRRPPPPLNPQPPPDDESDVELLSLSSEDDDPRPSSALRPPKIDPDLDLDDDDDDEEPDCWKRVDENEDDKIADLELKCLLSLQKRKDRALSGVLLESSDFVSPRSGCLTPLSSARGPIIGAHQRFPQERECISLPNSSRESATRKDKSLGPPLQDSLRSRFCKHPTPRENSELFQIECTDLQIKGPLEQKLIEQGITPVYEPKCCQGKQQCSLLPLIPDVSDLRVFLVCPGPKAGGHIQCHIRRVVSTYKLYPRFDLILLALNSGSMIRERLPQSSVTSPVEIILFELPWSCNACLSKEFSGLLNCCLDS